MFFGRLVVKEGLVNKVTLSTQFMPISCHL